MPDKAAGRRVKCQKCGHSFAVAGSTAPVVKPAEKQPPSKGKAPVTAGTMPTESSQRASRGKAAGSKKAILLVACVGITSFACLAAISIGGVAWWSWHSTRDDSPPAPANGESSTAVHAGKPLDPPPGLEPAAAAANTDGKPPLAAPEENDQADKSKPTALSGEEIYQRLLKSTTWIIRVDRVSIAIGSGALVHVQRRLVITNHHVVGDNTVVAVCFPSYQANKVITEPKYYLDNAKALAIKGRVVGRDQTRDLALIELESLPGDARPLALAAKSPDPGQRIHSIGASGAFNGVLWRYISGSVRQVYEKEIPYPDGQHIKGYIVETQSAANPGDSGGPVVDDRAQLIAVVHGRNVRDQAIDLNIDIREVRAFLEGYFKSIGSRWQDTAEPSPQEQTDALALIKRLNSADGQVRAKAALALGEMGVAARIAIPALLKALKDGDTLVRRLAAEALEKVGPPSKADVAVLSAALKDESVEVRVYAAAALGKIGRGTTEALPALIGALRDGDANVRQNAATSLGEMGVEARRAVPALIEVAKDPKEGVRRAVLESLVKIDPQTKSGVPALLAALKDTDAKVRQNAIIVLTKVRAEPRDLVPRLSEALQDLDQGVRQAAATALAVIGRDAEAAVPALAVALRDRDLQVRVQSAVALGAIGPEAKAAVPTLIEALKDSSSDFRQKSALALEKIGPEAKDAAVALGKALRDKDKGVRTQAAEALRAIGPGAKAAAPDLVSALEDEDLRFSAAEALLKFGKAAVPALLTVVKDGNPYVRFAAITVLGKIGPEAKAAETILEIRGMQDPLPEVRAAARKAVRQIRTRQ